MSSMQSPGDTNFKIPSSPYSPSDMPGQGYFRGSPRTPYRGDRGFHNQSQRSPRGNYGNQNRNYNNQGNWDNRGNSMSSSPSPGKRGDGGGSRDRRRSNSNGREPEENQRGYSPSNRDRSGERQSNGRQERRHSKERYSSSDGQSDQSFVQSPQSGREWGKERYSSSAGQSDQSFVQSPQSGREWDDYSQTPYHWQHSQHGQYNDNSYYGNDNSYYDDRYYDQGPRKGGRKNFGNPDRGRRGSQGGRYGSGRFSPEKSYYRRNDDDDVFLSKTLSSILRHNAERFGFKLMKGGFLYVDDILQHVHKLHGFTLDDVRRVVDSNDKKRFALEDENGRFKIRANQGHSLEVEDLDLQPVLSSDDVPLVIHGTYYAAWELIKKTGLHRMNRNHIHFAAGEPGENGVISGMRKTCEVMIYINMEKALKDGLQFYRSANNVILCEGDKDGIIYPCYFLGALDRLRKHRLEFDDQISASSAVEKPEGGKKRKKKTKGKNKEEDWEERVEDVAKEFKRLESEDGATTDESSLPVSKKQHTSDSKSSESYDADISQTGTSYGAEISQTGTSYGADTSQIGTSYDADTSQTGTSYDADTSQTGTSYGADTSQTGTSYGADTSQAGTSSTRAELANDSDDDEVKSKHWNTVLYVKDANESKAIMDHWCSHPPSHIAVCCVGENLGAESSRIRAIVVSAHPDSYIYLLSDENTSLVKEGHLDELLMSKDINRVFHDIGPVSASLINEFDILMDGTPIWDIKMLFEKVKPPEMDLEVLKVDKKIFKTWAIENDEFGKKLATEFDPTIAMKLGERGELMWDLHRVCFKTLNESRTKKLKKEIFQAAVPASDNFLAEKIQKLKLEKKAKKSPEKSPPEQQQKQQQQKQQQQGGGGKSGKGKGKGKKK